MADKKIVHPEGKYKIAQVGPTRDWDFNSDSGKIAMKTYSIQLEGIADWVDFNQKADVDAPTVGQEIEGHVEDAGQYGLKFQKKRGSGGFFGGKGSSAGAQWSAAFTTAATLLQAYAAAGGLKVKNIGDLVEKTEQLAVSIKAKVDAHAGAPKKEEESTQKTESESGESPAPADNGVVIDDVSDEDLGKW